jgi:hypothetical protein
VIAPACRRRRACWRALCHRLVRAINGCHARTLGRAAALCRRCAVRAPRKWRSVAAARRVGQWRLAARGRPRHKPEPCRQCFGTPLPRARAVARPGHLM